MPFELVPRIRVGGVGHRRLSVPGGSTNREVITLSRIAGRSHGEIADRLGSTPGAVRTQLNRALVRLTSELERLESGGG